MARYALSDKDPTRKVGVAARCCRYEEREWFVLMDLLNVDSR